MGKKKDLNVKRKMKKKAKIVEDVDLSEDDLMTKEDKEFLAGVDEDTDGSEGKDFAADGQDLDNAEIASFLKKLNFSKFSQAKGEIHTDDEEAVPAKDVKTKKNKKDKKV